MEYTKLGRSGLNVSRLCLGTMNFGPFTTEEDAFRMMDEALESGINFFDTANVYGGSGQAGRTETIIGKWFAQGGGRREKVVLATKVYGDMRNDLDGPNGAAGLSAYKIRRSIDASLRRLQTDHVELYQMHHVDRSVSWDELWEVFASLIKEGKVVYMGSSNFAGWDLAVAQYEAKARRLFGLVSEQHKYNLNTRLPELEVLPAALELGIGIIPWSPLDGGLLGRNALNPINVSRTEANKQRIAANKEKLLQFEKLAQDLGEAQDNIALAWLLANPAVTAPIIGPRTSDQLKESQRALTIRLGDDEMARIDAIFPGPGGAAPKAYAW
ncbi:MAG: aldo/keto reductase [Bacillota bacterium]|nr:aldo/keto reductase [Bacillota bacterium]